jgi:hypothetical protein
MYHQNISVTQAATCESLPGGKTQNPNRGSELWKPN